MRIWGFVQGMIGALWASTLFALPVTFEPDTLIRDAEVEDILHQFADPLLQQAKLSLAQVRLFLIASPAVNAASTEGNRIFINTGLILRCASADELIAVLAHEIGHLQKCHIIKLHGALSQASATNMALMGLGGVIAALTGKVEPLVAGAMGGGHVAERFLFKFTRTHESEADQASYNLLHALKWPVGGAETFLKKLQKSDLRSKEDQQNVYAQTHPLYEDRIRCAQQAVRPQDQLPHHFQSLFSLIQIKILAYTLPPDSVFKDPRIQKSPNRAYAEAISFYRQGKLDDALQALQRFVKSTPYGQDLKAQILLEKGDHVGANQAISSVLQKKTHPHASLLILAAQIKLLQSDSKALQQAQTHLEKAIRLDPDDPLPWRFLSEAHDKLGQIGERDLALAEYYTRLGERARAVESVNRVLQTLPPGSPTHMRARDLAIQLTPRGSDASS